MINVTVCREEERARGGAIRASVGLEGEKTGVVGIEVGSSVLHRVAGYIIVLCIEHVPGQDT